MGSRRVPFLVAVGLVVGLSLALGSIGMYVLGGRDEGSRPDDVKASEHRFLGPVDLAEVGEAEAVQRLRAFLGPLLDSPVTLAAGGVEVELSSIGELGVAPDVARSVRIALEGGEGAEPGKDAVAAGGLVWNVDRAALREGLMELATRVYRPPVNASIQSADGSIVSHQNGRMLDMERAEADALAWLAHWATGFGERRITLPVASVVPAVTSADLERLAGSGEGLGRTLLTGFTTYYDESVAGRAANVRLSANLIDGVVLLPGETFSFNETVGPRLASRGFLPAPEIVGEEFVEGIGGGICQVSSTLYNAVLYADLKVVERYRHSVPLGYVPPGRDATLQYGVMDFRFKNTLDEPIVVRAEAGGGRLRVSLWGSRPLPYDVRLSSEQTSVPFREVVELDPSLMPEEARLEDPGEPGRWIIVSKVVRDGAGGEESAPQIVSRNFYPPKVQRVRAGSARFLKTAEQAITLPGLSPVP